MGFKRVSGWLQVILGGLISLQSLFTIFYSKGGLFGIVNLSDSNLIPLTRIISNQLQFVYILILIISVMILLQGIINIKKKE